MNTLKDLYCRLKYKSEDLDYWEYLQHRSIDENSNELGIYIHSFLFYFKSEKNSQKFLVITDKHTIAYKT